MSNMNFVSKFFKLSYKLFPSLKEPWRTLSLLWLCSLATLNPLNPGDCTEGQLTKNTLLPLSTKADEILFYFRSVAFKACVMFVFFLHHGRNSGRKMCGQFHISLLWFKMRQNFSSLRTLNSFNFLSRTDHVDSSYSGYQFQNPLLNQILETCSETEIALSYFWTLQWWGPGICRPWNVDVLWLL